MGSNMRLLFLCLSLAAATQMGSAGEMRVGIFRGSFAGLEGTAASGVFEARNAEGGMESCGYDSRSYFERAHQRLNPVKMAAGDPIEVLADRRPGARTCYARIVHVLEPARVALRPQKPAPPASIPMSGPLARGDRTVAGLVERREPGALWIKTRSGRQVVSLRPDTRYVE